VTTPSLQAHWPRQDRRPENGGYRVSGKWSFGSGIHQATFIAGSCLIFEDDRPKIENGIPVIRLMLMPASDVEIHDAWHVSGLRGTGSEDYSVKNIFVPGDRAFMPFMSAPTQPGPLYRLPATYFISQIALVPLGLARAAIDALIDLAKTKVPQRFGPQIPLRERARAQSAVAQA